jgi:hypothetical protein
VTSKTKSVLWLLGSAAMLLPLLHPEWSSWLRLTSFFSLRPTGQPMAR